ncbi:hypothetical protein BO94DRAFT_269487 [Aspergillus sclerotioniger CBS 115572]|uniref:Uncharacterized protein n=1 Tax=Aspergillus sclerotioniger CBS 115572 TaxID=1450535 RepID=A0A317VAN9_9EURO|nr:hypothetical protein BO94DRAFT_269487 [Aspergillus sclerotioniger CBS 115572]PWY70331.1 hypothetical protein BO94DRAFT_269487 [Aspergillus sclerotioniger CBS 115572]
MTIGEVLSASSSTNSANCTIELRPYYEHDAEENNHHNDSSNLCEHRCGLLLYEALNNSLATSSYINVPENSPLRGGWPALAELIDPIEHMSFCEACPREPAYRDYFHTVCDGIVRQYKNFYQILFRQYNQNDFVAIYYNDYYNEHIFTEYIRQIDRILDIISRLSYTLAYQPVYDGDSWNIMFDQAIRLSDATYDLRDRVMSNQN